MPLLGPNCMGLVNHALGVGVTFIPEYSKMPRQVGPIAFVSQSGALGYCLAQAAERGLGYRYFFSVGNSGDVDVADLIGAMAEDPEVRAIACLFEGVPDARRLLEAGGRARAAGKPVIVYKMGVSDDGAAAARSHTGSMAGSAAAFRALFDRAGFVAVDDYEALVEYAKFFAAAGKPLAPGVAVVSGSGGAGIMADLKTFGALRTYGMAAITAVVAQNTRGVRGVRLIEPDFVAAQIDAVFDDVPTTPANHVRFRLSPDVVIELGARAKRPGEANLGESVALDACRSVINVTAPYQRLLGDALRGDQTLFARTDAVDASWRVVEPVLNLQAPVRIYPSGTWGPSEAAEVVLDGGWHDPA